MFCPILAHPCNASYPSWQKRNVSKSWERCRSYLRKVNRSRGQAWALARDCPRSWHSPWSGFGSDSSIVPGGGQGQLRGWYGPGAANIRALNTGSLFQKLELFCPWLASGPKNDPPPNLFSSADVADVSVEEMFIPPCYPHPHFYSSPVP